MTKQQSGTDGTDEKPVADDDGPVPRIPRSAGFKLSMPALIRILLTAAMLTMIIVAQRPCADAVSGFVTSFDNSDPKAGSGSAASQMMPKPGTVDMPSKQGSAGDYEPLRPDMTEAEIKAAIERAKARAREAENPNGPATGSGSAGSGSAAGSGLAGSGSAGSGS